MSETKIVRTTKRVVKPHATIANISFHLEKHAQEYERGSALFRMAGLVMEAHFVEGYSTVVAQNLPNGEELLEIKATKARLKAIFKAADPEADFGTRPYQSIIRLIAFRDKMAHPKIEVLEETVFLSETEAQDSIDGFGWKVRSETEHFCTRENSTNVRADVREVLRRTWHKEWESHPLDSGMQIVGHSLSL